MFLIQQGEINQIICTLAEKTTIASPTYLFELVNDVTRNSKVFIALDVSAYTERYNEFEIEETSSEDLYNGKIHLSEKGFYSYRIFEQQSTTNLLIANTGPMVESGKLKVEGTTTSVATYDNQPKQYVTYES